MKVLFILSYTFPLSWTIFTKMNCQIQKYSTIGFYPTKQRAFFQLKETPSNIVT